MQNMIAFMFLFFLIFIILNTFGFIIWIIMQAIETYKIETEDKNLFEKIFFIEINFMMVLFLIFIECFLVYLFKDGLQHMLL